MLRFSAFVVSVLVVLLLVSPRPIIFAQGIPGIRSVDFRNFTYDLGGTRVRLRNGKYTRPRRSTDSIMESALVSVRYVDFDGDGKEEAAVDIGSFIDGTMGSMEDYFVFAYKNGVPQQIFHESKEKGAKMIIQGRSLIISAPFWKDDDAHCCPSAIEVITYQWRGAGIVRVSRQLRPNT